MPTGFSKGLALEHCTADGCQAAHERAAPVPRRAFVPMAEWCAGSARGSTLRAIPSRDTPAAAPPWQRLLRAFSRPHVEEPRALWPGTGIDQGGRQKAPATMPGPPFCRWGERVSPLGARGRSVRSARTALCSISGPNNVTTSGIAAGCSSPVLRAIAQWKSQCAATV